MASEPVLVAQSVLYNAGMLPAAPDGYWGPQSRFALILFQEKHGLFADGVLNEETFNRLREFAKTDFDREDGLVETTKSITYIQKLLESLKLLESDVGNYYGPKTFAAVSKFQSTTKDLVVDGLAGPKTREALKSAVQSSDQTNIPTDSYSARKKWNNHPNANRVLAWMTFHQSLREEVGDLRDKWRDVENLQNLLASKSNGVHRADVMDLIGKAQPRFERLMNKLNSHAQYEDTSLFLFFQDIRTESLLHQLPILTAQHSELDSIEINIKGLMNEYTNLLEEGRSSDQCKTMCTRIKTLINTYQNLIIEHLSLEETSILIPWLNLSEDQYQSYLTYYQNAGSHALPKEEEFTPPQTKAVSKEPKPKPVLRDIYGRRVDPFSGGCCFAGETTCCKSTAFRELQSKSSK